MWADLKARILSIGSAHVTGESVEPYITYSTAGPGAGRQGGSIFFKFKDHRVRLSLTINGQIEIRHLGSGYAVLIMDGNEYPGELEMPGLHCPRQAYITVTSSCIFHCKYCGVPGLSGRKELHEIEALVKKVLPEIDAISLTSGVLSSVEEEEEYILQVVKRLIAFKLPIGVSIYPTLNSPSLLHEAGACEVKFNLEAATNQLFEVMCPDLDREIVKQALYDSVNIFGRGHVFSNIILGLGETDKEMEDIIYNLCQAGIIPIIRPLSPREEIFLQPRPSAERIIKIYEYLKKNLLNTGLDPSESLTMCPLCTGCDLTPVRDDDC